MLESLRGGLDVATRDDLARVAARVDELSRKVDRLARERVAQVQQKVSNRPAKK